MLCDLILVVGRERTSLHSLELEIQVCVLPTPL